MLTTVNTSNRAGLVVESSLACYSSGCHMPASLTSMYSPKIFFAVGVRPTSRTCECLCTCPLMFIFNKFSNIYLPIKILHTRCPCRCNSFFSFILFIEIQVPLWPQKYDTAVCMDTFFFSHTFTFQLLDKPWSQVSSLLPPVSGLNFLSRIGFSNATARRHFMECLLLTHALALSASQSVHKKKSQRIVTSMYSARLELTKLTYIRVEDNLIRHRGDRLDTYSLHSYVLVQHIYKVNCVNKRRGSFMKKPCYLIILKSSGNRAITAGGGWLRMGNNIFL